MATNQPKPIPQFMHRLYQQLQDINDLQVYQTHGAGNTLEKVQGINKQRGISIIGTAGVKLERFSSLVTHICVEHITVKVRSVKSGYRNIFYRLIRNEPDFDDALRAVAVALDYQFTGWVLPQPHAFIYPDVSTSQTAVKDHTTFSRNNGIKCATTMGIVRISNDGSVSQAGIEEHDQECWYLLQCRGYVGSIFNLITNGDSYYLVNRVLNVRNRTRIASSVKREFMTRLCPLDQLLISAAITDWVSTNF